jgi:hypothetical protein
MTSPRAHVALLVDFANLRQQIQAPPADGAEPAPQPATADIARSLVRFASSVGRLGVSRAYADWSREPKVARELSGTRLVPVLVPATEDGEDRSHIRLVVDAMETLFNGDEPDAFIIVSSDPSLVPLVQAIRADGSEVIVVAADEDAADELLAEADQFARFKDVLDGLVGEPLEPRAFADHGGSATSGKGKRRRNEGRGERDGGGYDKVPVLTESDFREYEWDGFIRLIDELEQRLPFVGVRYLVNKVLAPHNCGISDPHIKRDLINEAVDEGMIEMYTVGNVNERTDPVTACRLDRENPRVAAALGEALSEALAGPEDEAAYQSEDDEVDTSLLAEDARGEFSASAT